MGLFGRKHQTDDRVDAVLQALDALLAEDERLKQEARERLAEVRSALPKQERDLLDARKTTTTTSDTADSATTTESSSTSTTRTTTTEEE